MRNSQQSLPIRIVHKFLHSNLSILLIILSLVLGAAALMLTAREEEPQIVVPLADIFIQMPGASAAEVEQQVSTRLERLLEHEEDFVIGSDLAADLDEASEADPRNAQVWTNRGLAYERLGDRTKAAPSYSKAVALRPHDEAARSGSRANQPGNKRSMRHAACNAARSSADEIARRTTARLERPRTRFIYRATTSFSFSREALMSSRSATSSTRRCQGFMLGFCAALRSSFSTTRSPTPSFSSISGTS